MNPMFLSFLKSMQTKSQDAQNPGLWVNGNRMPMQEELARKLDPSASSFFKPKSGRNNYLQLVAPPVDADGNREVTPEEAARSAALSAEIDASVKADRVRAQLQDQDKVVTDTRNPLEYAKEPTYDELDQRAAAIKRRRGQGLPVYSPDSAYEQDQNAAKAVVAGLQENTNRSMFLTHLQGMQTKSQNAQNPGLWVNGNRMPVQESLSEYYAPDFPPGGREPGFRPRDPRPYDPMGSGGYRPRPGDFIKPRPRTPSPDWNPDYPYPKPGDEYRPRPRLPGLINPKPKSPTEITVDDIINPNTGNVSLSTGEANKPGAVTLYPAGQNILNPPAKSKSGLGDIIDRPGLPKRKPDLMRPGTPEDTEMQRRIMEPIKRWKQENPDQNRYGAEKPERIDRTIGKDVGGSLGYRRLKPYNTLNSSGEPLGIIPPTDSNLMNRMY